MDENGYPEKHELDKITNWHAWTIEDFHEMMDYVGSLWTYKNYWTRNGNHYEISTGGWSGNEELIGAMMQNAVMWSMWWNESKRGGHYVFGPSGAFMSRNTKKGE